MQNKPKAELNAALMLLDTRSMSFDMREIDNRRFMFSPQAGELILGRQYRGGQLYKSHAEEHFDSGAKAPFDSFIRGWIGTGRDYPDGVIHFAPNIGTDNIPAFDNAFSTLQMFSENGAAGDTVVRGFGRKWEQPLKDIITPTKERSKTVSEQEKNYSSYENVKNSTVKPTERFREEGVGREPFSKGVSSDRLKCSSCRNGLGKILSSLFHGRKSSVGRVDPSQVVVLDVSVNHALYLIRRHFCRVHLVQLLLLQCSEKALHSRVVVTSARAAHALYRSVFFQAFAEHRACVLASPVAVQDHAARSRLFTCVLKCGAA